MLRRLRDEGLDVAGRTIESRPQYFLGALASPCAALPRYEAIITEKKINAGAQFLQTPPIFDLGGFTEWLEALDKRDLLERVYLMPAVALLKNIWHARFLASEVPGVHIPVEVMSRLEDATDAHEESIQIALELIAKLKEMPGIQGLHILAPHQEEIVLRLLKESGLGDVTRRATAENRSGSNGNNKPRPDRKTNRGDSSRTGPYPSW
jgi:methylenetetrahydrofolate reductase (NADPH)